MKLSKEMKLAKRILAGLLIICAIGIIYVVVDLLEIYGAFNPVSKYEYQKNYRVLPNCTNVKQGDCHKPKLWGAG